MDRLALVEHYARGNRWAARHPLEKACACAAGLALVLAGPSPAGPILAGCAALGVLRAGGVPLAAVWRVAMVPLAFLLAAAVPLAISVSMAGGWHLVVTEEGVHAALAAFGRGAGGLCVTLGLALTTSVTDVAWLLVRLRVPRSVADVLLATYRFVFVLRRTAHVLHVAQRARGGFNGWRGSVRSTGVIAGTVFARGLDRAVAMERGMAARGGVPLGSGAHGPLSVRTCGAMAVLAGVASLIARMAG